jgi:hypothetical protein
MEPQQLFLADGKPIKPHVCGKCNRIWESKDSAERCCTCSYCHEYCAWKGGATTHTACQDKQYAKADAEALERATLISDYDGPFLMDERYFADAEELFDYYADEELPEEGHCCVAEKPFIDIGSVIEGLDMHEDWEPVGYDELAAAVDAWNKANAGNVTWYEDRARKWSKAALLARNPEART